MPIPSVATETWPPCKTASAVQIVNTKGKKNTHKYPKQLILNRRHKIAREGGCCLLAPSHTHEKHPHTDRIHNDPLVGLSFSNHSKSLLSIMIVISMLALAGCPTTDWEQGILDSHNTWRAATSPPAKDMVRIRWDTNIQANMAAHLRTCDSQWPHSDQNTQRKDVGGYELLGENLAYCAGTGCDAKLASGTPGYIGKGWWDEKDDYNYATDTSSGITSHYTQMASSNIYAMGCVAQKCAGPGPYNWQGEWWWFGCQYGERGRAYWSGTKPFDEGTGGLIEPDATVFTKNPGLCQTAPGSPAVTPTTSPATASPAGAPGGGTPPAGGGGGSTCPLTDWEQGILDSHNTWRAATSPPAKDMVRIRWDTNIQANMAAHLRTCDSQWPHSDQDTQRKDVGGYEWLGENLAYCAGTGCAAKLASGTPGYIGKGWWDEKDDYNYATDTSSGITSHYTQMASSNIYAMGCVAQKCAGPGPYNWQGEWWWFGCQYGERGRGYWSGTKPFDEGTGGLIEPDATVFTKNPGLCKDGGSPAVTPTTSPATASPVVVTSAPAGAPGGGTPPAGGGGSTCPLTDWEQGILDSHNTWRAATSPPAKDMVRIRWDTNIQANMAAHLRTCDSQWPHSDQDTQRKDVGGYEWLGENLAYCAGTGCDAKLASGTPGYIGKGWWDEKDDYNYATDTSSGITSHYTQMASSNIYAMGCVAQKCAGPGPYNWQGEWWWFGCQYGERGRGYWSGTKPFDEGTGGLIEPDATVFTKNPGLCKDGDSPAVTTAPATSPPVTVSSAPSVALPTRPPVTLAPVTGSVTSTPVSPKTSAPSVAGQTSAPAAVGTAVSDTVVPGTVQTPSPSDVLTAAESETDDEDDDGSFPWLPFVLGGVFLLLCSFVAAWFFITRAAKPTLKVNELLEEGLDEDMPKQDNDHFSL